MFGGRLISAIAAARSRRGPASIAFRACLALLLAAHISPALARPRSARPVKVGVCEAIERLEHFRGRTVTIEGHVLVDTHGIHLLEPGCNYEFNLVGPDHGTRGARQLHAMTGRLRAEKIIVIVRATGEVRDEPPEYPNGTVNLLGLLGARIHYAKVKVLSRQSLSRQEWRRYREWLADPRGDPFG